MRVLIYCPRSGAYFDGRSFEANRETAFDFYNARAAIEMIQNHRLPHTEIVLAYNAIWNDIRVSSQSLVVPEDIIGAAVQWSATAAKGRIKTHNFKIRKATNGAG